MSKDRDQPSKPVCVGKIASPHGVRGLVKISPYCEDVRLIEQVASHKITIKSSSGKHLLAEIEGVNSREEVRAIQGTELFIERDKLPEIEDDNTFYYEDLVGLKTVDEDGNEAGKVIAVHNFGAGDLLEIKPTVGKSYLVPFSDPYVKMSDNILTIDTQYNFHNM